MTDAAETIDDGVGARGFLARLLRNRSALLGGAIVLAVALAALLGPMLAAKDWRSTDMAFVWEPPGDDFALGADQLGRDVLARLLTGARVSLAVAGGVLAIAMLVGVGVGMLAAWRGGWIDAVAMRAADITFAFPELIIAILVAAMLGPGIPTVILSLAVVSWPGIARLTRSLVMSLRGELFIDAAIACGTPGWRILLGHCLPNIVPALIVRASVGVGFIVMAEATLSFLGLGVQEPLPSWGGMIRDGLPALRSDPFLALFASAALGATIIGFNMLGDGLRDLLDPRLRER
ncbi:MAG: ABC transporter permease [Alphaproteobacteria bacterium]|nr:ABC transporter permease [Alphaproteobacteria bacterium]